MPLASHCQSGSRRYPQHPAAGADNTVAVAVAEAGAGSTVAVAEAEAEAGSTAAAAAAAAAAGTCLVWRTQSNTMANWLVTAGTGTGSGLDHWVDHMLLQPKSQQAMTTFRWHNQGHLDATYCQRAVNTPLG